MEPWKLCGSNNIASIYLSKGKVTFVIAKFGQYFYCSIFKQYSRIIRLTLVDLFLFKLFLP